MEDLVNTHPELKLLADLNACLVCPLNTPPNAILKHVNHFVAGSIGVEIPGLLSILPLVSSLTFNQSSKSVRDYPDGFQRVRVRCQADVRRLAIHLLERVIPVRPASLGQTNVHVPLLWG